MSLLADLYIFSHKKDLFSLIDRKTTPRAQQTQEFSVLDKVSEKQAKEPTLSFDNK